MTGKTCAGLWVRGTGTDGAPREVYLYHVVDNAWSMREYGCQAVVWQTAINPVVALELLATGAWSGVGVLGPGGVRRGAVPRPADGVRIAVGAARGRLIGPVTTATSGAGDGRRGAASAARRSTARRSATAARSARQRATTASTSTGPTGTAGPTGARTHSAIRRLSSRTTPRTACSSGRPDRVSGSRSISRRSCSGVGSRGSDERPSRRRYPLTHQSSSSGRRGRGAVCPCPAGRRSRRARGRGGSAVRRASRGPDTSVPVPPPSARLLSFSIRTVERAQRPSSRGWRGSQVVPSRRRGGAGRCRTAPRAPRGWRGPR